MFENYNCAHLHKLPVTPFCSLFYPECHSCENRYPCFGEPGDKAIDCFVPTERTAVMQLNEMQESASWPGVTGVKLVGKRICAGAGIYNRLRRSL